MKPGFQLYFCCWLLCGLSANLFMFSASRRKDSIHCRLLLPFYGIWSKAISIFTETKKYFDTSFCLSCHPTGRALKTLERFTVHRCLPSGCTGPFNHLYRKPVGGLRVLLLVSTLLGIKTQKDPITNNLHILSKLQAMLLCFQTLMHKC